MRFLDKVLPWLLILIVPALIFCAASNLTLRMPDLYQNEFKATEVLSKEGISVEEDAMGEFISDYMFGKLDAFQLTIDDEGESETLFTKAEQDAMGHFRHVLNIMAFAIPVLLVIAAAGYLYLYKRGYHEELRRSFLFGATLLAVSVIGEVAIYHLKAASAFIYDFLFAYTPVEGELLGLLLPRHFAANYLIWGNIVLLVMTIIVGYITFRITKPRRMFG